MRTRFTNSQKDLDAASLRKKLVLVCKDIRSLHLTKLPRDAISLDSGTNWRDAYDAFILQAYKLDKPDLIEEGDMDDVELLDQISPDFWLKSTCTKYLMAVMIHCNKELEEEGVTSLSPGLTRSARRSAAADRVMEDWAAACKSEGDTEHSCQFKKMKLTMTSVAILKQQNDIVLMQLLGLFNVNKNAFIKLNGQDVFNQKIGSLL